MEPEVPCLGDTLTFTLSGVVDEGGIKRVDCYAKTVIPPVVPSYTWVITKPDATTVSGSGAVGTVVADMPGNYSCTFTATASRECPPAPLSVGPAFRSVNVTATLTLDPSSIPAKTAWSGPNYAFSNINVQRNPPECAGSLEVVLVEPQGSYVPPNQGSVKHLGANLWRYFAFDEPQTEKCPELVKVWIAAVYNGIELPGRKSILVLPVHTWWTTGHKHGPGQPTHPPDVSDFMNAYNHLRWKYAGVLASTGGVFATVTVSGNVCVRCPPVTGPCVAACTNIGDDTVRFGTSTFTGSENRAASIIGHELVHTTPLGTHECDAYTWEVGNASGTGVAICDVPYTTEILGFMGSTCQDD